MNLKPRCKTGIKSKSEILKNYTTKSMATFQQFQKRIQKLTNRKVLELNLFIEIKRFENLFIKFQKEQLLEGETRTGDDITGEYGSTYKPVTENYYAKIYEPKSGKDKITGQKYNMSWDGDFVKGLELIVDEDSATFWSTDSKTETLTLAYDDLFGLQPDKLKELISRVIYPAFMNSIREDLHLSK